MENIHSAAFSHFQHGPSGKLQEVCLLLRVCDWQPCSEMSFFIFVQANNSHRLTLLVSCHLAGLLLIAPLAIAWHAEQLQHLLLHSIPDAG